MFAALAFAGTVLAQETAVPLAAPSFQRAKPGWEYAWPRDHGPHREFKTEWWYFTGNLRAANSRRIGYQLTFFRQGIRPPGSPPVQSRFIVPDLNFGHFTITDVANRRFLFSQELSRGAYGEAGFATSAPNSRLAWLGDWSLELADDGGFRIRAKEEDRSLDLRLTPQKPWVVHGKDGISIKAERSEENASHYYSGTRLRSVGTLTVGSETLRVEGESWFDHEWATNQLAADQAGWDWFSLQFEDGSELMLYRLRKKNGTIDAASSGTYVAPDGTWRHLKEDEMLVSVKNRGKSQQSEGDYPNAWQIRIPSLQLELEVTTPVENQELVLQPITYWEGMVDAVGTRSGKTTKGHGYVELTGYAGPIVGLAPPEATTTK